MHKEVLVIPDANTVINPGAVIVPTLDTTVTDNAVVRPWSGQNFAAWTYVIWVKILQQVHYFVLILKVARVSTSGHEEAKHDNYPQENAYSYQCVSKDIIIIIYTTKTD